MREAGENLTLRSEAREQVGVPGSASRILTATCCANPLDALAQMRRRSCRRGRFRGRAETHRRDGPSQVRGDRRPIEKPIGGVVRREE